MCALQDVAPCSGVSVRSMNLAEQFHCDGFSCISATESCLHIPFSPRRWIHNPPCAGDMLPAKAKPPPLLRFRRLLLGPSLNLLLLRLDLDLLLPPRLIRIPNIIPRHIQKQRLHRHHLHLRRVLDDALEVYSAPLGQARDERRLGGGGGGFGRGGAGKDVVQRARALQLAGEEGVQTLDVGAVDVDVARGGGGGGRGGEDGERGGRGGEGVLG